jgi:hypothetical protein
MPSTPAWATRASAVVFCIPAVLLLLPATSNAGAGRMSAPHLRLGEADNGRSVHVLPRTRIDVDLRPDSAGGYRAPHTDRLDVLREEAASEDDPQPGHARAEFVALEPGYATIISDRDAACGQFLECDTAAHPYRVHVAVDHSPSDSLVP